MTARLTVAYGLDADAYLVARAVDRALEGAGYLVSVEQFNGADEVWITQRGTADSTPFLPGQLLVVTYDDGWRIEDGPGSEAAA